MAGRKQYRFWCYKEDEALMDYLDSLEHISETLKDILTRYSNGELIVPNSGEDLKNQKIQVDIEFKKIMIKIKQKELDYWQIFKKTPSFQASKAMKIGVENILPDTPSCFDETNHRIMCPACGSCFVFSQDQKDIPEAKENFIDHYIQKHGMKFPPQLEKELKSF